MNPLVLTGWKEIAGYLGCGVRTVQRWEKEALPVHRPLPGRRSHVIAYSEELDWWVRDHQARKAIPGNVIVSLNNAQKLREQNRQARAELRVQIQTLRREMANLRGRRRRTV